MRPIDLRTLTKAEHKARKDRANLTDKAYVAYFRSLRRRTNPADHSLVRWATAFKEWLRAGAVDEEALLAWGEKRSRGKRKAAV